MWRPMDLQSATTAMTGDHLAGSELEALVCELLPGTIGAELQVLEHELRLEVQA